MWAERLGSDLTVFPTTTETVAAISGTVGAVTFTIIEHAAATDDVNASNPTRWCDCYHLRVVKVVYAEQAREWHYYTTYKKVCE